MGRRPKFVVGLSVLLAIGLGVAALFIALRPKPATPQGQLPSKLSLQALALKACRCAERPDANYEQCWTKFENKTEGLYAFRTQDESRQSLQCYSNGDVDNPVCVAASFGTMEACTLEDAEAMYQRAKVLKPRLEAAALEALECARGKWGIEADACLKAYDRLALPLRPSRSSSAAGVDSSTVDCFGIKADEFCIVIG